MTTLEIETKFPKPCPFCGERENIHPNNEDRWQWWHIECAECGARSGEVRGRSVEEAKANAWAEWNQRVGE